MLAVRSDGSANTSVLQWLCSYYHCTPNDRHTKRHCDCVMCTLQFNAYLEVITTSVVLRAVYQVNLCIDTRNEVRRMLSCSNVVYERRVNLQLLRFAS
jgi:hypothetical protein